MNPNREELLFQLALTKPAAERAVFLDVTCEGDAALRQRLDVLLAAHEQPETLLATQAESVRLGEDASARQARPTIKTRPRRRARRSRGPDVRSLPELLERGGEGGSGVV